MAVSAVRVLKSKWTILLLSTVTAFLVLSRQNVWRNFPNLSQVERENIQENSHIQEKLVMSNNGLRNIVKASQSPNEPKEATSSRSNESCNIDYLIDGFKNTEEEYERFHLPERQIYSDSFLQPRAKVQVLYPKTTIQLQKDYFILPYLIRGPNNQLLGLRESIYVAIRLNRTLVVPPFFKHRTDGQRSNGSTIHPLHRVDFGALCRFIPCITLRKFRKACGNKVDVIMKLRSFSRKKISAMESLSGMRFAYKTDPKTKKYNYIPEDHGKSGTVYFGPNEDEIKQLFKSEGRCAIYGQPFLNMKIKVRPSTRRIRPNTGLQSYSNTDIFSEIIRRTPAPKYIRDIASNFAKSILGKNGFLTVHWRYDKKDWMVRCDKISPKSGRGKKCQQALQILPSDVAKAIISKIEKLKYGVAKLSTIYIAAPPGEMDFVKAVKLILRKHKLSMFSLEDLSNFIEQQHGSCEFLRKHKHDIESSIEMQICAAGRVFMRSSSSSWSSNVMERRRHNVMPGTNPSEDEDIFIRANKIMNERINISST